MKKKIFLFGAAGLLATAGMVAATSLNNAKKAPGKAAKTEVVKEKKSHCNRERTHCFY